MTTEMVGCLPWSQRRRCLAGCGSGSVRVSPVAPAVPDLNQVFVAEDEDEAASVLPGCAERTLEGEGATDVALRRLPVLPARPDQGDDGGDGANGTTVAAVDIDMYKRGRSGKSCANPPSSFEACMGSKGQRRSKRISGNIDESLDEENGGSKCGAPNKIMCLYEHMTKNQKKMIQDVGFGGLLDIKCPHVPEKLAYWLVSIFDMDRSVLVVPGRGTIPINEQMFEEFLPSHVAVSTLIIASKVTVQATGCFMKPMGVYMASPLNCLKLRANLLQ